MKVVNTFSAKKGQSGLPRPRVELLDCIKTFGIKEDKFAGLDENTAVMVVGLKAYELARDQGIELEQGALGENILFDFDPHDYEFGDIIKVGEVSLELKSSCTICSHLSVFDKTLPKLVKNHRGVYCKVLSDGIIKKDMQVNILKEKKEN